MTTIAYKEGVMAADSLSTVNGIRSGPMDKVFSYQVRLNASSVMIGFSGSPQHFSKAIRQIIEDGRDPLEPNQWPEGDYMALIVVKQAGPDRPPADVYLFEGDGEPFLVSGPFHAIGSGSEIAIGAMAVGATALQAVNHGIALDINSGGPALTFSFQN